MQPLYVPRVSIRDVSQGQGHVDQQGLTMIVMIVGLCTRAVF